MDKYRISAISAARILLAASWFILSNTHLNAQSDSVKTIEIKNADALIGTRINGQSVQKLIGRVALQHDQAQMFCDSAWYYDKLNSIDAFGRIHIRQGDTLSLYGDKLNYNGNTRIATITGNVRLIDKQVNLQTNQLTYDRNAGIAYYPDGGNTISQSEQLSSKKGYYYVNTKEFAFKGNVIIKNPQYTLYSDTLIQNTLTDVAYFKGPSTIVSKESFIYCENGWYDKRNDRCQFNQNAYVIAEKNILRGDSLYYERNRGYGKGIGHVSIEDTVEKIIVTGHFAETFRNIERYIVTDSAQLIKIFDKDTLFLHADTLLAVQDSLNKRVINAFHHVKFFKPDMQGLCDSLSYTQRDSLIRMYYNPILWNEKNQITANNIEICLGQKEIYFMNINQLARIISQEDSLLFNQVGGVNMKAWFKDNELHKIDVFENSKTFYYVKEDNGDMIGLNIAQSKDLTIYVENKQIVKISFLTNPVGTLHPMDKINPEEYRIDGFTWQIHRRPVKRTDIFIWN
jgi:lipopolysaccharide export system protein LptA